MLEMGARNSVDRIEEGRALLSQGQNQLPEWIPRILLEHNQMAENIAEVIQQTSARISRRELTEGGDRSKVVRRTPGRRRDEGTRGVGIGTAARQGGRRHEHVLGRRRRRRRLHVVVGVVRLLVVRRGVEVVSVHVLGEHVERLHMQGLLLLHVGHFRRRPGVVLQVEWRQG